MEYNYHKLNEQDIDVINSSLNAYVSILKQEKEKLITRNIKRKIDEELNTVFKTMENLRNSLNIEEE